MAGYFIDFAARHPRVRSRLVLAIEADGASYHSAGTARARDRLRQQHLERLGWRFHRIWSTDWFNDPDSETQRAVKAYQEAVAASDAVPVVVPPAVPVVESVVPERAADAALPSRTLPKPTIWPGAPIGTYSDRQLQDVIRWIRSDEVLRTEAQLIREAMRELGYSKLGSQIRERVTNAVHSV